MPLISFVIFLLGWTLAACKARPGDESALKADASTPAGWTWAECVDPAKAGHLVAQDPSGRLVCEGRIDTLYSWGPKIKIDWLVGQPWAGPLTREGKSTPIYATQSAFASFGYGPYAIRMKLRPGVRFEFFESTEGTNVPCSAMKDPANAVALLYWKKAPYTGVDFLVCSLSAVESWSYGRAEHYAEMRREIDWIVSHSAAEYETYVKRKGVDELFPPRLDGHDFSSEAWSKAQDVQLSLAPGRILVAPTADTQAAARHFKSAWPNYIQPR